MWTRDDTPPWADRTRWSQPELTGAANAPVAPAPSFPGARLSAVLIALSEGDDGPQVLLTRRSRALRNHAGEISFPGGRVDPGETVVDTALREAHEEVGLEPTRPLVLGELSHLSTVVSRSYIVPIVSQLDDPPTLRAETGEVDRVMWTPISELTAPGVYHRERWGSPPMSRWLHFFELDDETVWGATAHMLVELLTSQIPDR